MLDTAHLDRVLVLAQKAEDAELVRAIELERKLLVFVRAGRTHATGGARLSIWRVGSPSQARILVARCAGVALLHLLAGDAMLDVRTLEPASEHAFNDVTDKVAVKAFRESVRRGSRELKPIAPMLAHELRRTFRILGNVAFLQRYALSPRIVTRENHADVSNRPQSGTIGASIEDTP